MATHSSTLAWKIPWTEKPGRLQSMGLQKIGYNWATSLHSQCAERQSFMGFLCFLPTFLGHCRRHISKESATDVGLIPGLGRSPGVGNGNLFQYSCLKISMVRGAWQATVHNVAISQTQLSMHIHTSTFLHVTRMQGPDHFLPGSFLRVMFTVSTCEEWNKLSLQDK